MVYNSPFSNTGRSCKNCELNRPSDFGNYLHVKKREPNYKLSTMRDHYKPPHRKSQRYNVQGHYSQRVLGTPKTGQEAKYAWAVGPGYDRPTFAESRSLKRNAFYQMNQKNKTHALLSGRATLNENNQRPGLSSRSLQSAYNVTSYRNRNPGHFRLATPWHPSHRPAPDVIWKHEQKRWAGSGR